MSCSGRSRQPYPTLNWARCTSDLCNGLLSLRYPRPLIAIFIAVCAAPFSFPRAHADQCSGLQLGPLCISGEKPERSPLDPADKDKLLRISNKGAKKLNENELYKVNLTCGRVKKPSNLSDWKPFIQTTVATSHVVALTSTQLASSELPKDGKAYVTVFAVSGDQTKRQVFLNDRCEAHFAISGRDTLWLDATANQTSTNQPGPLTSGIISLIQVAIPILPLFKGLTAAATIFGDVTKSEDASKNLFSELNKGITVTQSKPVYQGDNIVLTPYSQVTVQVAKIKSVSDDPDLRGAYENSVKDAKATLKLDNLSADLLEQGCNQFTALMQDRNLSTQDIAYGLVMLTQLSGFGRDKTLTCMGKIYALEALKYEALWKRYKGFVYNEDDAKARFANTPLAPAQPTDFSKVDSALDFALNYLGSYSTSNGVVTDKVSAGLQKHFAENIYVINETNRFAPLTEGDKWTRDAFLKAFLPTDGTIWRVGCLTSDTEGIGLFLAFSAKKKDQTDFKDQDAIAFRIWVDGDIAIAWVKVQDQGGLVEKALAAQGGTRNCGSGLTVQPLPKPPAQAASQTGARRPSPSEWRQIATH